MKILEVTWRDAVGEDSGWTDIETVRNEQLVEVKTVGYLLAEKEDCITLTMSLEETNEKVAAYLTIPLVNITKMVEWV